MGEDLGFGVDLWCLLVHMTGGNVYVHGGHNARRRLEARRALICAVGMSRGQRRDLPTERVARRGRPPDGCVRPWSTAPSGGRAVLAPRRGSAHRVGHREPCCSDRPRFAQRPREPSDRTPRRIAPEGRRHVIDACVVDPVLLTFPTDDVARSQATDQVDGLLEFFQPGAHPPVRRGRSGRRPVGRSSEGACGEQHHGRAV